MSSLFEIAGTHLVPSDLTRGGWTDYTQHGGPPCGILARAVEAVPTLAPMMVARFTVDLIRPVTLEPLRVETRVIREGKRIQLVDGVLLHGETELGLVRALKIRIGEIELPDHRSDTMPFEPDELDVLDWAGHFGEKDELRRFHYDAVEIRTSERSFVEPGPGASWFRLRVPLVAGETPTPFVTLATLADMANGNGQSLDPTVHSFVNPDLSLHLHRYPVGEWIGMQSQSHPHPHGVGMADTTVYDRQGRIGRIIQSQIIDHRA